MEDLLITLLVSCVPAIATGFFAFFTAKKNANAKIRELKEQNDHELSKLMEQHKIDIESLKEKHMLEMESKNADHKHKMEVIELEHKNDLLRKEQEFEASAKYNAMNTAFESPEKLLSLLGMMENPDFQKYMKK